MNTLTISDPQGAILVSVQQQKTNYMINYDAIKTAIERDRSNLAIAEREFPKIAKIFNELPGQCFYAYFYPASAQVIAHIATRAAFAPLRALRRGLWEKSVSNDEGHEAIRYTGKAAGVSLVIFVRELPPSCRIIEESVTLPAQPERIEKVRRIECDPTNKEEARLALTT